MSAANNEPPQKTDTFAFDPEWRLEASDSFATTIGAMGFGVSFSFSYSFDAGINLPVSLEVTHPQYVLPNSTYTAAISAYGAESARAWAYASGACKATLDAGLAGSLSLVDESINLGDDVTFRTPVGKQETELIEADVELGSQTFDLLLVKYTVELRLKITSSVTASTSLTSHLSMSGDALESPVDSGLEWTEEGQPEQVTFSVGDETGTFIDMSFDDVTLYLSQLTFNILSFTVYLVVNGQTFAGVTIPFPSLSFNFAADGSPDADDAGYQTLADASGTTRNLGSKQLSIHVGVPFMVPMFLSPGFLLMMVPAAVGIAYGRKRENGSKALGAALLLTVLFGAALNLGLSLSLESGLENLFLTWIALIFPAYTFTGDIVSFIIVYLPWIFAGLAIGGATKRPRTGAVLAFGIPLAMFLTSIYVLGGLSSIVNILSLEYTRYVLVCCSVSALMGGAAGYICRNKFDSEF